MGYAVEVEPGQLVAEVAKQAANSDGWVKIIGDWIDRKVGDLAPLWPADVAAAAIAQAHRLGVKMTAHCFGEESVAQLVRAGIDCIEHGTGADTQTLKIMAERQIPIVPTMTNLENFPIFAAAGDAKFPVYGSHMRALYARRFETMREAFELGVPLYCGTDAGGTVPHGLIAGEVKLMAKFSNNEFALGAASWNARKWLCVPHTLADGCPADFVAYAGDPRENLDVLDHPEFVVLAGRLHLPHAVAIPDVESSR
jgi:imidazolonepropionase-like amidohydrolase